ncbi:PASTA domain-containing protein [Pseudonocardia sp.]|uniref:PASTA domain-containing protein n=1 Tax=Pseudonocardia sp. TaxID=60912 RepID=UPI0031FBA769
MPRIALAALAAAATVAVLTGCGGGTTASTAPTTVAVAVPAPAPQSSPAAVPQSSTAVAAPVAESWTMPDLVGSGLQEAQDSMQELTAFGIAITTSHDATGAGRMQVSDRNWKVCSQNVPPGATVTPNTPVDFGAVKLGEEC